MSSRNDELPTRTARDTSRTGLPEEATTPAELAPRTELQIEMMKNGGPYSPSLYGATAPLRQAQKKTVDNLLIQQMITHTKILEEQLAKDEAEWNRHESSRSSFQIYWKNRQGQIGEAVRVAKLNIFNAKEKIPRAEKMVRDIKKMVLACERDQEAAENILIDAEQSTNDAQDTLQYASLDMVGAKIKMHSAEVLLKSVSDAEKNAQNKYNAALECWQSHHDKLVKAKSMKNDAVKGRANLRRSRDNVRVAKERARADQDNAEMLMESARGVAHHMDVARNYMKKAKSAMQKAEEIEYMVTRQMRMYNIDVVSAEAKIAEAEGPEHQTRQTMQRAKNILQNLQNQLSDARETLNKTIQVWETARKADATARKILVRTKKVQGEANTKFDTAKENTEKVNARLQQVQDKMPSAEVLKSARRDLDVATEDLESAQRRYHVVVDCITSASKKEKSSRLLRAADETHLKNGAGRWNAEGDTLMALEQIKDGELWAQERFASAKIMREAGERLHAVRKRYTESVLSDAEYSIQLAREWKSQAQATLDGAKKSYMVAMRWLNDAEIEGRPHGGEQWSNVDKEAFAGEQHAIKNMHTVTNGWDKELMQWAKKVQEDADYWDALVKDREAEEIKMVNIRMQDTQSMRDTNNAFNLILKSLERVPEPSRTESNIDVYLNGVEVVKRRQTKQEVDVSGSIKHSIFMREYSEVEQRISSGQIDSMMLDALDATLANIHSERVNISRDGEAGVTPSIDRQMLFEEGTLVLANQHLILYGEGLNELERIPLNLIKKCEATEWLNPVLNIHLVDRKKKFHLPEKFMAGHSKSDEYKIWKYLIDNRKAGGREVLHVQTVPPGAVVLVNKIPCGITPLTLERPIIGGPIQKKYEIHILLEGYAPKSKTVDWKISNIDEKMKRLKKSNPQNDMVVQGYRRQLPEGSTTELFVMENLLNGENGTSLVLSKSSLVILSMNKQVLLSIPYGALESVETYRNILQVSGLKVTYRQAGKSVVVKFVADMKAISMCSEIKNSLKEKMQEWSDREPRFISNVTRLPRTGYTFLDV